VQKPLESCNVCHGDTSAYSAKLAHASTGVASITNVQFAVSGGDLVMTYNAKIDGTAAAGLTNVRTDYRIAAGGVQSDLGTPVATDLGSGNYSVVLPGAAANPNSRYFLRLSNAGNATTIVASGDFPAAPRTDLVSNMACNNCHGDSGIKIHTTAPNEFPAMVASECVQCHTATTGFYPGFIKESWVGLVHGIHNSHNMPGGKYTFTNGVGASQDFEVTYPTYMTNCSVCHDTPTTLAAANAMTVTTENCFSCHGSIEGFGFEANDFHTAFNATTNCLACHSTAANVSTLVDVADFHNGLETERVGFIWNGEDVSVTEGKKIGWKIDGIVDDKTSLKITWSATYDADGSGPGAAVAVNPCATTVAAGQPGFHAVPVIEGNLSILRSYVKGDDFVGGPAGTAPGQPNSAVNLTTTNTVCAGNVATTTVPVEANVAAGTRGIVAIQGKPQVPLPAGFGSSLHAGEWVDSTGKPFTTMYVRVPTPTREFVVGTGALPTTQRRAIAQTSDCLKCHVGSLYQHGNTRVDNVTMCVMCHNEASSEQNVRVGMGVDASEAYDGLPGQTYGFKSMLHMLHSAGEALDKPATVGTEPIVIFRTRGIYAWASSKSLLPNWPAVAPTCRSSVDTATGPISGHIVFGSDPAATTKCQTHNFHEPTYPRPLNECKACHVDNFAMIPDQAKAVATTLNAGAAPWANQLDDTLQGAGAAACTSCHSTSSAKGHAYQNGWNPAVFPNGRQTIIDEAK
jgi:OmcA/MtrC family decaheme c-type cytochrome